MGIFGCLPDLSVIISGYKPVYRVLKSEENIIINVVHLPDIYHVEVSDIAPSSAMSV